MGFRVEIRWAHDNSIVRTCGAPFKDQGKAVLRPYAEFRNYDLVTG
jgi:hypothetical protein